LIAGQAAASGEGVQAGDRIGSPKGASQKLVGGDSAGLLMLVAAAAGVAAIIYVGQHQNRTDRPTSP
jgi:hypothetical protein